MHISDDFLPYSKNTLVLIIDRSSAKFYRAEERDFNLLEKKENERLGIEDTERYVSSSKGARLSKAQDEQLKEREATVFYKALAENVFEYKQKNSFEKLIIVVPPDDKNLFTNYLHTDIKPTIELMIPKQLTKIADDALIKAIDKERRGE